ncbi:zinc finger protein 721-like [Palaemon carinicauda]|uniref:zinc finger protein 721-like n=1 Tax=Palaemon carinicauda TaxID=392227 RepID=UPI0035B5E53B
MGYLACPVCERESLADVSDLQQRVAAALNRPLSCPICSASVSGIQAFHHHLAAHLPGQNKSFSDASPSVSTPSTPSALGVPPYPVTNSPEGIPTLEHLEINDNRGSPRSPSRHSLLGKEGLPDQSPGVANPNEPQSPSTVSHLSSHEKLTQPHNCDLCGLIFSSAHFLKFHKDIIHSKRDFFDVTCKLCKDKFKDFEAYRNHVRESHSDRRFICEQCPKTFKMKGSLLVHQRMFHDPSSPGTCQLCKKTFTTKARKELHEKRYHGVGLEHVSTGKVSPPSPSQKHQKVKSSSLGDAKGWLETLMIETRSSGEEGHHYTELQDPQSVHSIHHHQQITSSYSSQQIQIQQNQLNHPDEQMGSQFSNPMCHQQQNEQRKDKVTRDIHTQISQEYPSQKTLTTESDNSQLQKWSTDFQPYVTSHEKVSPPKNSPDMYYQQQKFSINLPSHVPQGLHGQNCPKADYKEFKQDKKFSVLQHGSESSVCRQVSGSYSQQSPVAIVSPQPQKAETPPADHQNNNGNLYPTEIRRNSFPLINVNKTGMSHNETSRFHSGGNYINELSLASSGTAASALGHNMSTPTLGDKIHHTAATASQQLIFQNNQSVIPALNSHIALMGSENKIGAKVPPLLVASPRLIPVEKVKEPPDSPVQMMQVQDESSTSEMVSECDVPAESKVPTDAPQELRPDVGPVRRQGVTGISGTLTSGAITRKESTGKADAKQWECDVCKKSFTTKYFLKKHKRLHTGETPYACAECGKTFTFQQSYHKHILYHSDDKPHQCSYCGRAFKEMSTLHNHVRIHTGEKPFVCENCGKAFRQRVSYLVHQRIHTGVMPYTCDACGRSFRYKVSLRSHKCEPNIGPAPVATGPLPRSNEGVSDTRGQSIPPSSTPLIHLPQTSGTATTPLLSGAPKSEATADVQIQQMASSSCPAAPATNLRDNELSYVNNNHSSPHTLPRHKLPQHQRPEQQDLSKHNQNIVPVPGRPKVPLETIDISAISCDSLPVPHESKKSPHRSNRSPSHTVSPRTGGGVIGGPGFHDPLSVAFLHALVDPQQGRVQGDCRPHVQLSSQEGLPFPSLSPGAMDTDLDHDNFLTNLLM